MSGFTISSEQEHTFGHELHEEHRYHTENRAYGEVKFTGNHEDGDTNRNHPFG